MQTTSDQNESDFSKQPRLVTMLKKRLRCFLASFVNFYIATAFETLANYFTNFWMTASGSFIIETAFCERDKNHKFGNFKTMPC